MADRVRVCIRREAGARGGPAAGGARGRPHGTKSRRTAAVSHRRKPKVSILISGPSRTGKTSAANVLAERYGIPNIKIGEIFRERTKIDTSKFVDRPASLDREMDEYQSKMIRSATVDEPFILEARLAAFLASKERQTRKLPVATVLFWAPEQVRIERQLRKVLRDQPGSDATLEELMEGERKREAGDRLLWK